MVNSKKIRSVKHVARMVKMRMAHNISAYAYVECNVKINLEWGGVIGTEFV